jgi:tetratricopeptide (TPR) repeat protein
MAQQALTVALLLALQVSAPVDGTGCTEAELRSLQAGLATMARGEELTLPQANDKGPRAPAAQCRLLTLQRLALSGWREARAVAPKGAPLELLAPVHSTLNELQQLKEDAPAIALDVEYAQMAVRAAVAAAQDERPEMALLLTHARDLSERLTARGRRAVWPRPFNLLAGELWFEVDRFEEARAAYERAVRGEASPVALVGMARAQARLGRRDEACATYSRARDAAAALRKSAAADLAHCR